MKASVFAVGYVLSTLTFVAAAQSYPTKPIRLVVTSAPGGSDDLQGRVVAQGLNDYLGQTVVENRPGGGAIIGRELVARAAPDGYTLLLGGSSMAAHAALRPNSKLDVIRDFTPISLITNFPYVLVVHPSIPAKSVKELIALGKANPGKLNFASTGHGQNPHLSAELFKSMAKLDMVHIPYQGSAPAYVDLMAGRVDMIFGQIAAAIQQIKAGKVRPLGVTGPTRSEMLPDVPTISESALPGYELTSWLGVFGPAGVPRDIVQTLNTAIHKSMAAPDARKKLTAVGVDPEVSSPEQLGERLKAGQTRITKVIREAGIKLE